MLRWTSNNGTMVPVDDTTLQGLRLNLTPGKIFNRNKTNIINTRVADLFNADGYYNINIIRRILSYRLEWEDDRMALKT